MADMEIELDNELIEGIKRLATSYYGDSGDASISRVVGAALEMRLFWEERAKGGPDEIEEPLTNWEFTNVDAMRNENANGVRCWLFRR